MTHSKPDKDTERIRQYADKWVDIAALKDEEAAQSIWDLELDILIDLAGHSGTTKLPLIARRLAPLQVVWCGYSGTSGIDTMDYIIVDNVLAPPGEQQQFREQPLRLPSSYLCFSSPYQADIGPLPYERNGYITFGCMNNPSKINSYVVSWWARILQEVPDSRILMRYTMFVDPLVRERIAKMFRSHGISPDRYEMLPGKKDFISVYNEVDIALDTFPYNGTTTTCEALWMGVPVVAIRGDRFVSRVGASLLTYTGLSDLITESPEAYIKLAAELANNPAHLADLRRQLRPHVEKTPVFNAAAFTKGIEQAYRNIFARWCESQAGERKGRGCAPPLSKDIANPLGGAPDSATVLRDREDLLALDKELAAPKNSQNTSELCSNLPI